MAVPGLYELLVERILEHGESNGLFELWFPDGEPPSAEDVMRELRKRDYGDGEDLLKAIDDGNNWLLMLRLKHAREYEPLDSSYYRDTERTPWAYDQRAFTRLDDEQALADLAAIGSLQSMAELAESRRMDIRAQGALALQAAASFGQDQVVNWLLNQGVDGAEDALRKAAAAGKEEIIALLLRRGVPASTPGALVAAAANNRLGSVEMLVEAGADVHEQEDEALRLALEMWNSGMSNILMEHGADIRARGGEMLLTAITTGNKYIAHRMLQNGALVPGREADVLRAAFQKGYVNIVRELIDRGVSVSTLPSAMVSAAEAGQWYNSRDVAAMVRNEQRREEVLAPQAVAAVLEAFGQAGDVAAEEEVLPPTDPRVVLFDIVARESAVLAQENWQSASKMQERE